MELIAWLVARKNNQVWVSVDNKVPTDPATGGQLSWGTSSSPLWPSLVEKAMAKYMSFLGKGDGFQALGSMQPNNFLYSWLGESPSQDAVDDFTVTGDRWSSVVGPNNNTVDSTLQQAQDSLRSWTGHNEDPNSATYNPKSKFSRFCFLSDKWRPRHLSKTTPMLFGTLIIATIPSRYAILGGPVLKEAERPHLAMCWTAPTSLYPWTGFGPMLAPWTSPKRSRYAYQRKISSQGACCVGSRKHWLKTAKLLCCRRSSTYGSIVGFEICVSPEARAGPNRRT